MYSKVTVKKFKPKTTNQQSCSSNYEYSLKRVRNVGMGRRGGGVKERLTWGKKHINVT